MVVTWSIMNANHNILFPDLIPTEVTILKEEKEKKIFQCNDSYYHEDWSKASTEVLPLIFCANYLKFRHGVVL
jgi:hypothetical protein